MWHASIATLSTTSTRWTTTWRCWSWRGPCAAVAWCDPSAYRVPRGPLTARAALSPAGARCVREVGTRALGAAQGSLETLCTHTSSPDPTGSMTRQLQKAAVRVLSEQTCRRFYPVQISSRMLCAGFPQGGVDSCSVSGDKDS